MGQEWTLWGEQLKKLLECTRGIFPMMLPTSFTIVYLSEDYGLILSSRSHVIKPSCQYLWENLQTTSAIIG